MLVYSVASWVNITSRGKGWPNGLIMRWVRKAGVVVSSPNIGSWVIPCQFNQALPHFVLDFFYMLTISAKICLGNIFQVIASKV